MVQEVYKVETVNCPKEQKCFTFTCMGVETKVMSILKGTSIKTDFIATNTINRLIYQSFKKLNKIKCGMYKFQ
jgi:hypothetical protein